MNKVIRIKSDLDLWQLDVLGVPYGGAHAGKDLQGEYFTSLTNLHGDKFPLPPVVFFHGHKAPGKASQSPEYIGTVKSFEDKEDGRWYRVVLDRTNKYAKRVWKAAKKGLASASTGTVGNLARRAQDGHILEWPVAELSLLDEGLIPVNSYAVALPVLKAHSEMNPRLKAILSESEKENASTSARGGHNPKTEHIQKGENMTDKKQEVKETAPAPSFTTEQITAAMKAALEPINSRLDKIEAEPDKDTQLPIAQKAVNVAQMGDLWKYDNMSAGDLAFGVRLLQTAARSGYSQGVSESMYKALGVRVIEDNQKNSHGRPLHSASLAAMRHAGMPTDAKAFHAAKADELNYSTQAGFGDEWIGVTYENELWPRIVQDTPVVANVPTMVVPQGSESVVIPLDSTPPTFYKVAQANDMGANPGATTNVVTVSKQATASKTLTVDTMGAAVTWTGHISEDAVVAFAGEVRRNVQQEASETIEHIIIDGDTATGATTNINDIGGTPGGTEAFLLVNGFRKSPLVTTTANSRDGGAITLTDYLETIKLMGLAGRNALRKDRVAFVIDLWTHWKSLELTELKTQDVYSNPTIENGMIMNIYGYNVVVSANMHRANQDATYGLKANSAGKLDLDTASNNTTGSILAVRWDQWRFGFKRQLTFEVERIPRADAYELTALMRIGLTQRDTEAAAISYNLTV